MAPIMPDGRGNFAGKPGAIQNANLHVSGFTAERGFFWLRRLRHVARDATRKDMMVHEQGS